MGLKTTLSWIAVALAGLVIAAGASLAASRLAGQRIGLDSEPITAGEELAPREDHSAPGHRRTPDHPRTTPQPTVPSPSGGTRSGSGGDDSGTGESGGDD